MGMSCNNLSPEKHAERLKLYNLGLRDSEIADALGMSPNGIADWRYRNGLPKIEYFGIDSSEDIQDCLHCKRKKCNNCKRYTRK